MRHKQEYAGCGRGVCLVRFNHRDTLSIWALSSRRTLFGWIHRLIYPLRLAFGYSLSQTPPRRCRMSPGDRSLNGVSAVAMRTNANSFFASLWPKAGTRSRGPNPPDAAVFGSKHEKQFDVRLQNDGKLRGLGRHGRCPKYDGGYASAWYE